MILKEYGNIETTGPLPRMGKGPVAYYSNCWNKMSNTLSA